MVNPFNLIVTHLPGPESKRRAIWILRQALPAFSIAYSRPHIILGIVRDPLEAVEILRSSLTRKSPILRVIPVLRVEAPFTSNVKKAVEEILRTQPEGSFAVRLDGYLRDDSGRLMRRRDAIIAIADNIDREVNLNNPDILVYIKVVKFRGRRLAAVYVGPQDNIISTVKMKDI